MPSVGFVSQVSTHPDVLTRHFRVQVCQYLCCLSLVQVYELWNWTWILSRLVVLHRVLCARIVGLSLLSIPLVVSGTQCCVSCLPGSRMLHIQRSCPAHPREENSRVCVAADHWPVSFFWHPNFHLAFLASRCPWCSSRAPDEVTVPDLLIVPCSD